MNGNDLVAAQNAIITAHCPECFLESSYKTLHKTLSGGCLKERVQRCFQLLLDLAEKDENEGGISNALFESLCLKLVETVERAIGLSLPATAKEGFYKSQLLPLLYILIDQHSLPTIFDTIVANFLFSSRKDSSLTLSVGPGSEITQMVPHDREFFDAVFGKYRKNVLMVFEGGSEGDFGDTYKEIFPIQDKEELLANDWFARFFVYLSELFGIDPRTIVVESPNSVTKVITIQYGPDSKKTTKIILYLGDYLAPLVEPALREILPAVGSRNLICGIRSGSCNELFFRDSDLFYSEFNYYVFTHLDPDVQNLKNTTQSFRMNLKRLRAAGKTKSEFLLNISKNKHNMDITGFPHTKLCERNERQPQNDPYCVQGGEDRNIFWRGLGGKKKRLTKRKIRKGRKTRKH